MPKAQAGTPITDKEFDKIFQETGLAVGRVLSPKSDPQMVFQMALTVALAGKILTPSSQARIDALARALEKKYKMMGGCR